MTDKVALGFRDRNPDVLTSIANLSNDEVFTPPELANRVLDLVEEAWAKTNQGEVIWNNPNVKFLDPFTKSGVFLREITRRLSEGLKDTIPNLQTRVDHITKNQVYGIAITQLTSLLARRSVYCSKNANGKHSISRSLETPEGNIWFEREEHTWVGGSTTIVTADKSGNELVKKIDGRCKFCGANQREYERDSSLESHAYALLHTESPQELIATIFGEKLKFDVVIGNPPYQLGDGGGEGSSAVSLYHRFVQQAIKLDPKLLTMVIPARWYSGGKGLDEFRTEMLNDPRISKIHDFPETELCFPNVNIRGGVCYFLWDSSHTGDTEIWNYSKRGEPNSTVRPKLIPGVETFIRYNQAVSIVNKVRKLNEPTFDSQVRARNPFGIPSNFSNFSKEKSAENNLLLYRSRRGSSLDKEVFVSESHVISSKDLVQKIKVLVSKASPGGDEYPHAIIGKPFIASPGSVCTETYLIADVVNSIEDGENLMDYMSTKLFRFLVSLVKTTQNISRSCFTLVPIQDLSQKWTDEKLFAKYGITSEEASFIDSLIKDWGLGNE
jgi:site-specific DNA-methyltransferase (adenine-specific)